MKNPLSSISKANGITFEDLETVDPSTIPSVNGTPDAVGGVCFLISVLNSLRLFTTKTFDQNLDFWLKFLFFWRKF